MAGKVSKLANEEIREQNIQQKMRPYLMHVVCTPRFAFLLLAFFFLLKTHYNNDCPMEEVRCPNDCGEKKRLRRNIADHIQNECPFQVICCPFKEYNCHVKVTSWVSFVRFVVLFGNKLHNVTATQRHNNNSTQ